MLVQIASCLAGEDVVEPQDVPEEVIAIAARCLAFALDGLGTGGDSAHTGVDATEFARTAYSQLRRIVHITELCVLVCTPEGYAQLLEGLGALWQLSSLLDVAECYWWSTDDESDHRVFLDALLKHVRVSCKTCSDDELHRQLESLIDRVQHASASVKAAAASALSDWFVDWAGDCSTTQLCPMLVDAALHWLYTIQCQQWQADGDSCVSSAFCKVKATYMHRLLEQGQHERVLQLLHAYKTEFAELAATTELNSVDLHAQLTCILSIQHEDASLELHNVMSSTDVSMQEQLQILLPLLVKNVNDYRPCAREKVGLHATYFLTNMPDQTCSQQEQ